MGPDTCEGTWTGIYIERDTHTHTHTHKERHRETERDRDINRETESIDELHTLELDCRGASTYYFGVGNPDSGEESWTSIGQLPVILRLLGALAGASLGVPPDDLLEQFSPYQI